MPSVKKYLITAFVICLFVGRAFADTTAPVTSHTLNPSSPNGKNDWYVTPVTVTLDATDLESGVKEINYRLNSGTWQKISFPDPLNLVTNPSFETPDYGNTTGAYAWEATTLDPSVTYQRDTSAYLPGFATASLRISSTAPSGWFAFNNKKEFAVAKPYSNMSAYVWVKTQDVSAAYFKVYVISQDGEGNKSYSYLKSSSQLTGTNDWTKISANFVVNSATAVGVYLDIGLSGSGTLWADAGSITDAVTDASTTFTIAQDAKTHTVEYYAVDVAGNIEGYSCPNNNCFSFKLDQTPPSNWRDSGSFRSAGGAEHEVFVFTNVMDETSGLSTLSNKYQYNVDDHQTFGRYANLLKCNTAWLNGAWAELTEYPKTNGVETAYLQTQKTDFCNSNWKICKTARFYAEDVAGNVAAKDFCVHGPWISFTNKGAVRANYNIDMIAEPEADNTDGLIETGGNTINFFTSSKGWYVKQTPASEYPSYTEMLGAMANVTSFTGNLPTTSGVRKYTGNYTITSSNKPSGFSNNTFNQIIFIDGDLTINLDTTVANSSTALFVVKGNVYIKKAVENLRVGIIADGSFNTASDIQPDEATKTLNLSGIFQANVFNFQRTLQGAQNEKYPSEAFTYQPKYLVQLKNYYKHGYIVWETVK